MKDNLFMLKKFNMAFVMSVFLVLVLFVCLSGNGENGQGVKGPAQPADREANWAGKVFSGTKLDRTETPSANAVKVDLSDVDGAAYEIQEGGEYILSGKYKGKIRINVEEQTVHLYLDGAEISSTGGAAICVDSAGKLVISCLPGTINHIVDGAYGHRAGDEDATVFSPCDLTINGTGELNVYGYHGKAIHSKDVVKITGCNIYIKSKSDGIQGTDGIYIDAGRAEIESEANGLLTTKKGKGEKGTVEIAGGELSVIAGSYAISSSGNLYINNCTVWYRAVLGGLQVGGEKFLMEGCLEGE